jgi:DNA-binding CsgD family transcriptional regulator
MSLVEQIHHADSVPTVLDLLHLTTLAMGARASLYAVAIPEDDAHRTLRILLACDPVLAYQSGRLCPIGKHPWYLYAMDHENPRVASRIPVDTAAQQNAVALATQNGFASALIIPTPSAGDLGRFGVFCLGSEVAGEFEADGVHPVQMLARVLAMELHEWFSKDSRRTLLRSSRLGCEELRLLAMERRGLGSKEIASALHLTVNAVDSRFKRINARLSCPNRASAARRAAEYGLI